MQDDGTLLLQSLKQSKSFELVVRQSPKRGRMTGFANDVRVIGPQLVLQLFLKQNGETLTLLPDLEMIKYVCYVSLITVEEGVRVHVDEKGQDKNLKKRREANLLGNCATVLQRLKDVDGSPVMLFVFPDLGIRSPGLYELECRLVKIGLMPSPILYSVKTDPFRIHSPRNYPGAPKIPKLSRVLQEQGIEMRLQ
ncbi:velvet factor [Gorgonomyces haynaldii]|nr:velvet factor [Gorgonomyces haynaldii]